MTYCVGIKLNAGLVFLSDSRTNAGVDNISTYRKMILYEKPGDRFMVLADFADYWRAQRAVDALWRDKEAWTRRVINSVANMGRFSADRAIDEYADHIWRTSAAR